VADEPLKKPGRPPADDPGSPVSIWLSASQHDQLIRRARERDESLSAYVRRLIDGGSDPKKS